jgi:hypothetical protein
MLCYYTNLTSKACCVPFLPAGLPRFDLLAQINEVEARQEEYTESLAFLGLVNALLEGVGQGGLPAGGTAVGHYTALVLQYIAGSLWQRSYRYEQFSGDLPVPAC